MNTLFLSPLINKMLTFSTTEDHLLISGKTFYVKDIIKTLGGKRRNGSFWVLPIFLDSADLRDAMQRDAEAACNAARKTKNSFRVNGSIFTTD
jgi:hypothetical protein